MERQEKILGSAAIKFLREDYHLFSDFLRQVLKKIPSESNQSFKYLLQKKKTMSRKRFAHHWTEKEKYISIQRKIEFYEEFSDYFHVVISV